MISQSDYHRLQRELVDVLSDVNNELCRIGYGDNAIDIDNLL